MRPNQFITKFIAALCLLVLSQKIGAGLYLHNIFHSKDYKQADASLPDNKSVRFVCNCIDDFTMPFTETDEVRLPVIPSSYFDHVSFYKESISFSFHFFNSLRAPPFSVA